MTCIVGMGLGIIGATVWTEAEIDAFLAAEGEMEDQSASFEEAVRKFCKCLHDHHH